MIYKFRIHAPRSLLRGLTKAFRETSSYQVVIHNLFLAIFWFYAHLNFRLNKRKSYFICTLIGI